jgi:hypothetical protein
VLLVLGCVENLTRGDLTHQKLNDNKQFLDLQTETEGTHFGRLALGLDQSSLRLGVLHLHGFDATHVVQITSVLVVRRRFRERGFSYEVAGLFIQILTEVRPNNDIHDSGLADLVVMENTFLISFEQQRSELVASDHTELFVSDG